MPEGREDTDDGDQALLAQAKRGGASAKTAYDALVRRHQAWLVRLLAQLLQRSPAEAEDIAQEAFVRTFAAIERIPEGANFRAWLRVTSVRLAYNHRRDAVTRARYLAEWRPEEASPMGSQLEAREALAVTLALLPYPYREILILRHVEEMALEDITTVLDVGLSAAKMRLSRARKAFLEHYDEVTGNG
ncbi:MAG: RNA polymerase sigma factor [Myxococcales bacterium]|nr:RNA polymerase sigma factor [Myxococcales bacterium]MDH3483235.1 RNA polymerase sigma factor [Myxococcales bacterium]